MAQSVGVYGVVGSGGYGVGLNAPLNPMVGIRGELAQFSGSDTYTEDQITYKGDVKLKGNGLMKGGVPIDAKAPFCSQKLVL